MRPVNELSLKVSLANADAPLETPPTWDVCVRTASKKSRSTNERVDGVKLTVRVRNKQTNKNIYHLFARYVLLLR